MEVSFVDEVGLEAAVTEASPDAGAAAEAPEAGPPEDAAPAPVPVPEPLPKPVPPAPAKASEAPSEIKKPVKPAPAKPAKAAPAKPVAKTPAASGAGTAAKPRGSRLGADFLKGLSDPAPARRPSPRRRSAAATWPGWRRRSRRRSSLATSCPRAAPTPPASRPCFGSASATDGTTATPPTVVEQPGVNADNRAYARQMADAAKRAVLRCAPLKLPAELYDARLGRFEFVFNPRAMG